MDAEPSPGVATNESQAWSRLALGTGVTGLVAMVALFTPIVAVSSVGEPPLDAPSKDAATFFRDIEATWAQTAEGFASLGMLVFLWFVVGFTLLLRRAEGDPPWRSLVALVSGVLVAAYGVLDASWDAAAHRGRELDPTLAGYAFDVGNIGFANAWLVPALHTAVGVDRGHLRLPHPTSRDLVDAVEALLSAGRP